MAKADPNPRPSSPSRRSGTTPPCATPAQTDAINTPLQQSNNDTLKQIVAVKDKPSTGKAEGVRFIRDLASFTVDIGTTAPSATIDSHDSTEKAFTAVGEAIAKLGSAQPVVTKAQILLQAGISPLSQANPAPPQVLSLLRGKLHQRAPQTLRTYSA